MKEIYYGIWATLRQYALLERALVIIAIVMLVLYLLMPFGKYIIGWPLYLFRLIWIYVVYFLVQQFVYLKNRNQNSQKLSRRMNKITDFFEKSEIKISKAIRLCNNKKRIRLRYFIAVYCLVIFLIALPNMVNGIVDEAYIDELATVRKFYHSLEKKPLNRAKDYSPLFVRKEENEQNIEETKHIWLSLSGDGVGGANIRLGPGKDNQSIKIVKGEERLLLLERGDGWIKVRTEDGTEGWISEKIVSGY